VRRAPAPAKLNLALVVGPRGGNGKHELCTVYQRIDLCDRVELEPAPRLEVRGFAEDTLVGTALERLAGQVGVEPRWSVRLTKRIPVAAGLGGGSSDAATALRLANETLPEPLDVPRLQALAAELGADVPFFLASGPQLGEDDGTRLTPLDLPQDYWVVVVLPHDTQKGSTTAVYQSFDARDGADGWEARRDELRARLASIRRPRDLAALPPNDLASSPLAERLRGLGAFRADVTGAGPAVYGLFHHRAAAEAASRELAPVGGTWVTLPAWYV
jgi:4-diphosphocytidyl-2-C-methyl-D-erythritol kinase